jgi:outer membrane protein TolC
MMKQKLHLVVALALSSALVFGAEPDITTPERRITLHEAVQLARQHNHLVRIDQYKVEEKQHAKEVAKSAYFPSIQNQSSFIHVTDTQLIEIERGSLGTAGGNADSSCERRHQSGRTQPDHQWHPADTAANHTAEDQAGE